LGGADGSYQSDGGTTKTYSHSDGSSVTVTTKEDGDTKVTYSNPDGTEKTIPYDGFVNRVKDAVFGSKERNGAEHLRNTNNSTPNPEDWKGFGQASLDFYMSNRLFKNLVEQWKKGLQINAGGAYGKQFSDDWSWDKIMYYDAMLGGFMMKAFNRQMATLKGKYGGKLNTDKGPNILDVTLLIDGAIDPRDPNAIKAISQGVFKINGVIQK
jgi:hypothetical protein